MGCDYYIIINLRIYYAWGHLPRKTEGITYMMVMIATTPIMTKK
jgi:hypothetical protein